MKIPGALITFFSLFLCFFSVSGYLENDGWLTIELHHRLPTADSDHFTFRGNITISSLSSGLAQTVQNPISPKELASLKTLAENNDLYKLTATVVYSDGSKQTFLTSTKACSFVKSKLTDVLWISVDYNSYVTGITQTIPGFGGTSDCTEVDISPEIKFNTDVLVRHMELAPVPDTTSFIQKVEREREAREKGEVKDNRGFFAKYWMYIVPVVLLVVISGATNPDSSGGN